MKKLISLLFLLISLISFAGVGLEIKGVSGKNEESGKTVVNLNTRTIVSLGNVDMVGAVYGLKDVDNNRFKNIELMYDGKFINIATGYQIKESSDNVFLETGTIFSKVSADIKYRRVSITPYVNERYSQNDGKEENHKYGAGIKIGYFFTEKVSLFSNGDYYERKYSSGDKEEIGIKSEHEIGKLKIVPEISIGEEKIDYDERGLYMRSNVEMDYTIGKKVTISALNFNEIGKNYRTNKSTLIGMYEIGREELGVSRVIASISYNDKGVSKFKRYELGVNKFLSDFEGEVGINLRQSDVREVYGIKGRMNFYFIGNHKIYVDITRENIVKDIFNISAKNRYEMGISLMY